MGRPPKCKIIDICLSHNEFVSNSGKSVDVVLEQEELQVIKLKDIDGLGCVKGAEKMGISKSTFANIYKRAHKKISKALIEGYNIKFNC